MNKRSILMALVFCLPFIQTVSALSPQEKLKVRTALQAVNDAIEQAKLAEQHGNVVQAAADAALTSATQAKLEAALAKRSAETTDQKAIKAEKQAAELKAQNDRMLPVYNQVNAGCGFGAFAYGFKKLFHCFLWFIAVIAIIAIGIVVASFFFPALAPAVLGFFRNAGGFVIKLPGKARALLAKWKPKKHEP